MPTILEDWDAASKQLPADVTPAEREYFSRQWLAQRKNALASLMPQDRRFITAHIRGIPNVGDIEQPETAGFAQGMGEQINAQMAQNPLANVARAASRAMGGDGRAITPTESIIPGAGNLVYDQTDLPEPKTFGEALGQVPTQVADVARNFGHLVTQSPTLLANPGAGAALAARTAATLADPVNLLEIAPGVAPLARGASAVAPVAKQVLGNAIKTTAASAASEGLGGAIDSAAQQYADTGKVSGPQLLRDTLTEAAVGAPIGTAGSLAGSYKDLTTARPPAPAPVAIPGIEPTDALTPELRDFYSQAATPELQAFLQRANPQPKPQAQPVTLDEFTNLQATDPAGAAAYEQAINAGIVPAPVDDTFARLMTPPVAPLAATMPGRAPALPGMASTAGTLSLGAPPSPFGPTPAEQAKQANQQRVQQATADEEMSAQLESLRGEIRKAGDDGDLNRLNELSAQLDHLTGAPLPPISPIPNPTPPTPTPGWSAERPNPWGSERAAEAMARADQQIGKTKRDRQAKAREAIAQGGPLGRDDRNYTPGGSTTFPGTEGTAAATPPALMEKLGQRKAAPDPMPNVPDEQLIKGMDTLDQKQATGARADKARAALGGSLAARGYEKVDGRWRKPDAPATAAAVEMPAVQPTRPTATPATSVEATVPAAPAARFTLRQDGKRWVIDEDGRPVPGKWFGTKEKAEAFVAGANQSAAILPASKPKPAAEPEKAFPQLSDEDLIKAERDMRGVVNDMAKSGPTYIRAEKAYREFVDALRERGYRVNANDDFYKPKQEEATQPRDITGATDAELLARYDDHAKQSGVGAKSDEWMHTGLMMEVADELEKRGYRFNVSLKRWIAPKGKKADAQDRKPGNAAPPAPAAKPVPPKSSTGLGEVGDAGAAIVDNMYDQLWADVEAGRTVNSKTGGADYVLQVAKRIRDAGGLRTKDEFRKMAQDAAGVERGPGWQDGLKAIVAKYTPAAPPARKPDAQKTPAEIDDEIAQLRAAQAARKAERENGRDERQARLEKDREDRKAERAERVARAEQERAELRGSGEGPKFKVGDAVLVPKPGTVGQFVSAIVDEMGYDPTTRGFSYTFYGGGKHPELPVGGQFQERHMKAVGEPAVPAAEAAKPDAVKALRDRLHAEADAEAAAFFKDFRTNTVGFNPQMAAILVKKGAAIMLDGVAAFADWARALQAWVREQGGQPAVDAMEPHLDDIYDQAVEMRIAELEALKAPAQAGGKMQDGARAPKEDKDGGEGEAGPLRPDGPGADPQARAGSSEGAPRGGDAGTGGGRARREGRRDPDGPDERQGAGLRDGMGDREPRDLPGTVKAPGGNAPATGNFTPPPGFNPAASGKKAKLNANMDALRLLRRLEAEGRMATPGEQETLAQYVGWGALPEVFRDAAREGLTEEQAAKLDKGFQEAGRALRDGLMTRREYEDARASTTNAHFTSREVIGGIYQALEAAGFNGGRVLEPSMGTGNFFAFMPPAMRQASQLVGVELDSVTGAIAKHLYPQAAIEVKGFQDVRLPSDAFDLVISNVPFSDTMRPVDPEHAPRGEHPLHDYFFKKGLALTRPGGAVAFITSTGTMDKVDPAARKMLADQADLVAAIRIPSGAFKKNAGTDVTTDLIILRKRAEGQAATGPAWTRTQTVEVEGQRLAINEYFAGRTAAVLGDLVLDTHYQRGGRLAVKARDGADLTTAIADALAAPLRGAFDDRPTHAGTEGVKPDVIAPPSGDHREGSLAYVNGVIKEMRNNQMVDADIPKVAKNAAERIRGMIALRDLSRTVLNEQKKEIDDAGLKALQGKLSKAYDIFVTKFGPVNGRTNSLVFRSDPDWPLVSSLEHYDAEEKTATKADIFTKRTSQPYRRMTEAANAKDALVGVLAEEGRVDIDAIARLAKITPEAAAVDLGDLIFEDPATGWQTADAYLSGNVRQKLAQAQTAAARDPRYARNVSALEAVQPSDVPLVKVGLRLGVGWVPTDIVASYVAERLDIGQGVDVAYNASVNKWTLRPRGGQRADAGNLATSDVSFLELADDVLNSKPTQVWKKDSVGNRYHDTQATEAARQAKERIKEDFARWAREDDARVERLTRIYNDTYNNLRLRTFDGSHLALPGQNPAIKLRAHQKNAVWRIIQERRGLLAHAVGAGKTYTMVAAGMEMRRLGIAKKPLYVVPNHLIDQWPREFKQLYPGSRVLAVSKSDLQAGNRKRLFARIALGDWDAVFITHSQLPKLAVSKDFERDLLQEQIEVIQEAIIAERKASGQTGNRIVKDLEKAAERLKSKVAKLQDVVRDDLMTFEQLGVDHMFVDEAHNFKNLFYATRKGRVKGLGNAQGSKRSFDLFAKARYLQSINGGRGVTFATGTPITNSLVELYTMQRFLTPEVLRETGTEHFDAWAAAFGDDVTSIVLALDGQSRTMETRFAKFFNLPELLSQFRVVADVQTAEMLKLPVPELTGGKIQVVTAKPTRALKTYTSWLLHLFQTWKGPVERGKDTPVVYIGLGRTAALSMRTLSDAMPDEPASKINLCVKKVAEIYHETTNVDFRDPGTEEVVKGSGTQMIFLDTRAPKEDSSKAVGEAPSSPPEAEAGEEISDQEALNKDFEVDDGSGGMSSYSPYHDIKTKLVRAGVPAAEIAFIHDAKNDKQKADLLKRVREGKVRILLGSTPKMGEGTNVQKFLVGLHHLDGTWTPAGMEQRNGRIIRQGNWNYGVRPVSVVTYATEQSFDANTFQLLETKQKFIDQIMRGDPTVREGEDLEAGASQDYSLLAALASGNPLYQEQAQVRVDRDALQIARNDYDERMDRAERDTRWLPPTIERTRQEIETLEGDFARFQANKPQSYAVTVGEQLHAGKEAVTAALEKAVEVLTKDGETAVIGEYAGFPLHAARYEAERGKEIRHGFWLAAGPQRNYSFQRAAAEIESRIDGARDYLGRYENALKRAQSALGETFPNDAKLGKLNQRLEEIEAQLKDAEAADKAKQEEQAKNAAEGRINGYLPEDWKVIEGIEYRRAAARAARLAREGGRAAARGGSVADIVAGMADDAPAGVDAEAPQSDLRRMTDLPRISKLPGAAKPQDGIGWLIGDLAGRPAYSNGFFMLEGVPPGEADSPRKQMDRGAFDRIVPANTEAVQPIGFLEADDKAHVVLDNGTVLTGSLYSYIMRAFPGATMRQGDPMKPVVFHANGKVVGILMPVDPGTESDLRAKLDRVMAQRKQGGGGPAATNDWADTLEATGDRLIAEADELMRRRGYGFNANGLDYQGVKAGGLYGAGLVLKGVVHFGRWLEAMTAKFGTLSEDNLRSILYHQEKALAKSPEIEAAYAKGMYHLLTYEVPDAIENTLGVGEFRRRAEHAPAWSLLEDRNDFARRISGERRTVKVDRDLTLPDVTQNAYQATPNDLAILDWMDQILMLRLVADSNNGARNSSYNPTEVEQTEALREAIALTKTSADYDARRIARKYDKKKTLREMSPDRYGFDPIDSVFTAVENLWRRVAKSASDVAFERATDRDPDLLQARIAKGKAQLAAPRVDELVARIERQVAEGKQRQVNPRAVETQGTAGQIAKRDGLAAKMNQAAAALEDSGRRQLKAELRDLTLGSTPIKPGVVTAMAKLLAARLLRAGATLTEAASRTIRAEFSREMIKKHGDAFKAVARKVAEQADAYVEASKRIPAEADTSAQAVVMKSLRAADFGKSVGGDFYAHKDGLKNLPKDARAAVASLVREAGVKAADFDLVKFSRDGRPSLLSYPTFHSDAFPALARSWTRNADGDVTARDYREHANRPILHRKELFLPPNHPKRAEHAAMTRAAEEAALFDGTPPGFERQWQEVLDAKGVRVDGNRIVKEKAAASRGSSSEGGKRAEMRARLTAPLMDERWNVKKTSIPQVPRLFVLHHGKIGPVNLDLGGGQYDLGTEALAAHGIKSRVLDAFSRKPVHNEPVFDWAWETPPDTVTIANVLNTIESGSIRKQVLMDARDLVKKGGRVLIWVYEGNPNLDIGASPAKSVDEKTEHQDTWQNNRWADWYMDEVREVFPQAEMVNKNFIMVEDVQPTGGPKGTKTGGRAAAKAALSRLVAEEGGFFDARALFEAVFGRRAPAAPKTPPRVAPPASPLTLYGEDAAKPDVQRLLRQAEQLKAKLIESDQRGVPLAKRVALAVKLSEVRAQLEAIHTDVSATRAKAKDVANVIADPASPPAYNGAKMVGPKGINFWRLDIDPDAKDFFAGVLAETGPQFDFVAGTKREGFGEVHAQAMDALATGRWDVQKLLRHDTTKPLNAAQITASRILMATVAGQVSELAKAKRDDTARLTAAERDARDATLVRGVELLAAMSAQTEGATKAIARALSAHRIMASSQVPAERQIKAILENGVDGINDLAERIAEIEDAEAIIIAARTEVLKDTWAHKAMEWWVMALLSAPITHARNIFGNALNVFGTLGEETVAAGISAARSKLDGEPVDVGFDEVTAQWAALFASFGDAVNIARLSFKENTPMSGVSQIDAHEGAIKGKLGEVVRLPGRWLMAEDEFFKVLAYRMSLAQQAAAEARKQGDAKGLSVADQKALATRLTFDPTETMADRARTEAHYRTFQQQMGNIGKMLLRTKSEYPLLTIVVPFVKTPVNIVKYAGERSPLAPFAKPVRDEIQAGGARRDRALAKMALGTTFMGMAAVVAAMGMITGTGPEDPEDRATLMATGWRPYAFKVAGAYLPFNQVLGPYGMLMGSMGDIAERWALNNTDQDKKDAGLAAKLLDTVAMGGLIAVRGNVMEQTFLRGLHDFSNLAYAPKQFGMRYFGNIVAGFVPNILGKAADAADPYLRDQAGNDLVDEMGRRVQAKIPGLSRYLPAREDLLGNPIARNAYTRQVGLTGLPFPAYPGVETSDKLLKEMVRLGENISKAPRKLEVKGQDIPLTTDQRRELGRLKGQAFAELARPYVETPEWDTSSEDEQRAVLEKLRGKASTAAREQYIDAHYDEVLAAFSAATGSGTASMPDAPPAAQATMREMVQPVKAGNIDLGNRPVVKNGDGSISTVRSISIGTDQGVYLIPTVVRGKVVSNEAAVRYFRQTGEHLGLFTSEADAKVYADQLHDHQARQYAPRAGR